MKTITTYADLIALFNEDTTRELHLHIERDCGTHIVSFYISTEDEKVAEGVMNIGTNDDATYTDALAWAVLYDCTDNFTTITEYDSLVAGTNPGVIRA
jgi:hypothetical protein